MYQNNNKKNVMSKSLHSLLLVCLQLAVLHRVQSFVLSRSRWQSSSTYWGITIYGEPTATQFKDELLDNVRKLRRHQERDGAVSVDFGVKGGELNETSRAPQRVDYYAVSPEVGKAADAVIASCDILSELNPTPNATAFLGDEEKGLQAPLHGPWKLLFTTAADASFNSNSSRGNAKVQNVVDAPRGKITNVIDFIPKEEGKEPTLVQLNVVIKAKAVSEKRVELNFRYAKAVLTKFLFFRVNWSLYIPVPATLITRIIVLFYRIFRRGKAKAPPKAYFDVLYLDSDLRIHKTGEDNLFVQSRPTLEKAQDLIE
uniref:Plastid lipid-associated protein/fibrillin conserved domain-containing protein n=1 Tax=Amphora coffeiformis TaxID=265554 RepID=A0A7S3P6V1_9STRA